MAAVYETFERAMARLAPGSSMALAVSGGADSLALLHLCCAWNKAESQPRTLVALTVDHGLREESAEEAKQVAEWAATLDVPHVTLKWSHDNPTANVEAEARRARYDLMTRYCNTHGIKDLLTGHHRDDQAETFLMRLMRGSGVSGLAAMGEVRDLSRFGPGLRLLRPLLEVGKADLEDLLKEVHQPWFQDPSNEDEAFTRSRVRQLAQTFAGFDLDRDRLVATAERMREADAVLQAVTDALWRSAVEVDPLGALKVDLKAYRSALSDTRMRLLSLVLRGVSGADYGPRYIRLLRLDEALIEATDGAATLHGCKVSWAENRLLVMRELRPASEAVQIFAQGSELWDGRFWIDPDDKAVPAVEGDLEIRAVGEAGLVQLKREGGGLPEGATREVVMTLPALWQGEVLLAVPEISYGPPVFKARFILID